MEEELIPKRSKLGKGYLYRYSEPPFHSIKVLVDEFTEADIRAKRRKANKAVKQRIAKSKEAFGKNIMTKAQKWKVYIDAYNEPLYMWAYKPLPSNKVLDAMEEKEFQLEDFEFEVKKADKFTHKLKLYMDNHPLINKAQLCREVNVSRGYLDAVMLGRITASYPLRQKIINVLKNYGWS